MELCGKIVIDLDNNVTFIENAMEVNVIQRIYNHSS
jgi:hypothetical protein